MSQINDMTDRIAPPTGDARVGWYARVFLSVLRGDEHPALVGHVHWWLGILVRQRELNLSFPDDGVHMRTFSGNELLQMEERLFIA